MKELKEQKHKFNKVLFGCLIVSVCLNIFLGVYIIGSKKIVLSEWIYVWKYMNGIDRNRDMIPDEETALKIAEAIIEADEYWTWEENVNYEVEVTFHEEPYEWFINYHPELPEGAFIVDGGKNISIRRDNGLVRIEY